MATKFCLIILPVPIVICPTSEFHICPSGKPTALPEASSLVCKSENKAWNVGVFACIIAFSSGVFVFIQNPSRMTKSTFSIAF
ncbi:TPA: hypothetical protein DIC40_08155 [Patescibacteria group bacterium]|nr:hypothetical protein [Candidatus Gracilibacteria bacterium]